VISYWRQEFAGHSPWQIFNLRSGLVFYGGLIGASLAVILKARLSHLPLWKLADVLAPSIALGHAFGRVGCLMTGCCYGRACDLPWAIRYPAGHETHPVGELATSVHPTQIYESLLNLALCLALAWLYRRKKFPGQVFATYLVGYAVLRAFVELFRGDYPVRYLGGHLTPGQLVSVGILLAGLVLFWKLPRGVKGSARTSGVMAMPIHLSDFVGDWEEFLRIRYCLEPAGGPPADSFVIPIRNRHVHAGVIIGGGAEDDVVLADAKSPGVVVAGTDKLQR